MMFEREHKLIDYLGEDRIISSHDLKEKLSDKKEFHYITKIPTMDKLIEGYELGELTTISGFTGNGKTLLAQTLTRNFTEQGINCLWFTYEMPPKQFFRQFGLDLPLFYLPAILTGNTQKWLDDRIYESVLKYETKAVFIDHLHYLVDMAKDNISREIGYIMRSLKKMCLKYKINIFLIAHTEKSKEEKEPDNSTIRDSSFVSQESDNVFFIWRKKSDPQQSTLKITKNRRCGIMNKKIDMVKIGNFLEEVDRIDED